eukprot:scaffold31989_cov54-Attheya_sp.AAC.3
MKTIVQVRSLLLLLLWLGMVSMQLSSVDAAAWDRVLKCFKCPTSEDYEPSCLKSSIPPWPICLLHGVDYWVHTAEDSATRCCAADDLSECKCPKKDTPDFQNLIGDWCNGVSKCRCDDNTKDHADTKTTDDPIVSSITTNINGIAEDEIALKE